MEERCFWSARANATSACAKTTWTACGYESLVLTPILLLCVYWLAFGVYMLRKDDSTTKLLTFDVARIHDPVAQGIAIALAQRRHTTEKPSHFQHNMKLCAMWAEWPALSYAPLSVALKVISADEPINSVIFSLNVTNETVNVAVACTCAVLVSSLWLYKTWRRTDDRLLRRFAYPITFDVLYIPLASTFLRMAVCPLGHDRVALPDGSTCDCLDRYGFFWAIGSVGFVSIYSCAIYYKMFIEPTGSTMDFRFETSFQIIMVMARTLNPLLSMLANSVGLTHQAARAVPLTLAFLASLSFLLLAAYKTQPCIGSGRLPNNIRVLSFSSSLYTTLCVLGFLVAGGPPQHLHYSLGLLPLIWVTAWVVNSRRAAKFHIPSLTIVELLHDRTLQAKTVGAIAALHVNPLNIRANDYEAIIAMVHKTVKVARLRELHCRLYCARLLWFCHIESYRRAGTRVGEPKPELALVPGLWFKDASNDVRTSSRKLLKAKTRNVSAQLAKIKIRHIEHVTDPTASTTPVDKPAVRRARPPSLFQSVKRLLTVTSPISARAMQYRRSIVSVPSVVDSNGFYVVAIRDKNWIAKLEAPDPALQQFDALYRAVLEMLEQSCTLDDHEAMFEAASFLLQWYRSTYLRLNKTIYLHVVATFCALPDIASAADATYTLHQLTIELRTLSADLWLANASDLNRFVSALSHPSSKTVACCAEVLAHLLAAAETKSSVNLYVLLMPSSIAKLHAAFSNWHRDFRISDSLERACTSLYCLQLRSTLGKRTSIGTRQQSTTKMFVALVTQMTSVVARPIVASLSRGNSVQLRTLPTSMGRRISFDTRGLMRDGSTRSIVSNAHVQPGDLPRRPSHGANEVVPPPAQPKPMTSQALLAQFEASPMLARHRSMRESIKPRAKKKASPDHCTFVTPEMLVEIQRRRSLRQQMRELLETTYARFETTLPRTMTDKGRHNASAIDVMINYTKVLQLYVEAEDCAMADYVATALDPSLRNFFLTNVQPFMSTYLARVRASQRLRAWWRRTSDR
ncbi:hypothetical protein SPRG_10268 [Saprolegnia parasitica CBS 223.65]|uniref:Uncharacterized protein n=1 Tax=Saprolegnia parasitica (strain CBS 223.65) TaxID=695850 RepID=A0A067C1V4_SAPPC|nr:hypothetical protein SPRG_10268 [Saprolegnia parasitica CBS 223.65]KDO24734.1 hypothetical protein SPRG_10268 [Saprolegnia parasitica CBS 223.65]|eukprot:XP_012204614.1 hypothetical protein SPRG_10268 [Saprolegnia parasitica CBS 223.65]